MQMCLFMAARKRPMETVASSTNAWMLNGCQTWEVKCKRFPVAQIECVPPGKTLSLP